MVAPVALAVLVSIAMVFPVAAGRPAAPAPAAVEAIPSVDASGAAATPSLRLWSDCVARVNQARAAAGKVALTIDTRLANAATNHSAYQAQLQQMTHAGPGGTDGGERMTAAGFQWSTWAENVAAGQGDCTSVVTAWLNSPTHKANILKTAIRYIGIGNVVGANGVHYWTMDLAA